jgi:hypothetical protein
MRVAEYWSEDCQALTSSTRNPELYLLYSVIYRVKLSLPHNILGKYYAWNWAKTNTCFLYIYYFPRGNICLLFVCFNHWEIINIDKNPWSSPRSSTLHLLTWCFRPIACTTRESGICSLVIHLLQYTDKKEKKNSSYLGKFRVERLQSHIWLKASSYMTKYLHISS